MTLIDLLRCPYNNVFRPFQYNSHMRSPVNIAYAVYIVSDKKVKSLSFFFFLVRFYLIDPCYMIIE